MMRFESPASRPIIVPSSASTPTLQARTPGAAPVPSPLRSSRLPISSHAVGTPQAPTNQLSSSGTLPAGAVRTVVASPAPSTPTHSLPVFNGGAGSRRNSASVVATTPTAPRLSLTMSTPGTPSSIQQLQPPIATQVSDTQQQPIIATNVSETQQRPCFITKVNDTQQQPPLPTKLSDTQQRLSFTTTGIDMQRRPSFTTKGSDTQQPPSFMGRVGDTDAANKFDPPEKQRQTSGVVRSQKMLVLPTPQRLGARDRSTSSKQKRMPLRRDQSREAPAPCAANEAASSLTVPLSEAPTSVGGSEAPTSIELPPTEAGNSMTLPSLANQLPMALLVDKSMSMQAMSKVAAQTGTVEAVHRRMSSATVSSTACSTLNTARPISKTPTEAAENRRRMSSATDSTVACSTLNTARFMSETNSEDRRRFSSATVSTEDPYRRMSSTTISMTACSTMNTTLPTMDNSASGVSDLLLSSVSALHATPISNRRVSIVSNGSEKVIPPCAEDMQSLTVGDVETTVGHSTSLARESNSSNATPRVPTDLEAEGPTEPQPQEQYEIWADWVPPQAAAKSTRKPIERCRSLSVSRSAAAAAAAAASASDRKSPRPKSMSALRQVGSATSDDEAPCRTRRSTMPAQKQSTAITPRWRQLSARKHRSSAPTLDSMPVSPIPDSWKTSHSALKSSVERATKSQGEFVARARSGSPLRRPRRSGVDGAVAADVPRGEEQASGAIITPRPRRMSSRGAPALETSERAVVARPRSPSMSSPDNRWPSPSNGIRLPPPPPLEDGIHEDGCRPHEIAQAWRQSLCGVKQAEDKVTINFSPRQLYSERDEVRDPPPLPLEDGIHVDGCRSHEIYEEWKKSLCGQKYIDDKLIGKMIVQRLNSPDPAWMTESQELAKYFEPLGPLHRVSEGWKESLCLPKILEDEINEAFSPRQLRSRSPNGTIRAPVPEPLEDGIEKDGCRLHEIDGKFRRSLRNPQASTDELSEAAIAVRTLPGRSRSPVACHPQKQLCDGSSGRGEQYNGQEDKQQRAPRHSVVLSKQEAAAVCAKISEDSALIGRSPKLPVEGATSSHQSSIVAPTNGVPTRFVSAPGGVGQVASHAVRSTTHGLTRTVSPQPRFGADAHAHMIHTTRPQSPPVSSRAAADKHASKVHASLAVAAVASPVRKASIDSQIGATAQRRSFSTGAEAALKPAASPIITPRAHPVHPITKLSGGLRHSISAERTVTCTGCGTEFVSTGNFCHHCGARRGEAAFTPSARSIETNPPAPNGVVLWAGSSSASARTNGSYRSSSLVTVTPRPVGH